MKISFVIPCFNEEVGIENVLRSLDEAVSKFDYLDYEIIPVDDGSHDNTKSVIQDLSKRYANVSPAFHRFNKGYGASLKTGITHSTKEYVLFLDADGQHAIKDIIRVFQTMKEKDCDAVLTKREGLLCSTLIRKPGKMLFSLIAKILLEKGPVKSKIIVKMSGKSASTISINIKKMEKEKIISRKILNEDSKLTSDIGFHISNKKFLIDFISKYNLT